MELKFEVKRSRISVTQGMATVYCNGEKIADFDDPIVIIKPGEKYFGTLSGGWASKKPDTDFIRAVLFHPFEDVYHFEDKIKSVIKAAANSEMESAPTRDVAAE